MVELSSGYRYYSRCQIPLARRIATLRAMHVPLAEVQILLNSDDPETLASCLEGHRLRIVERLNDYERILAHLPPDTKEWANQLVKERSVSDADAARTYICSFCGRDHAEIGRMISGPNGVAICNECVALCNEIIEREGLREREAKA
jgi:DNA-binding transcriptional MerR regulator